MMVMTLFKMLIAKFIFWLWSHDDYEGNNNGGNDGDNNDGVTEHN